MAAQENPVDSTSILISGNIATTQFIPGAEARSDHDTPDVSEQPAGSHAAAHPFDVAAAGSGQPALGGVAPPGGVAPAARSAAHLGCGLVCVVARRLAILAAAGARARVLVRAALLLGSSERRAVWANSGHGWDAIGKRRPHESYALEQTSNTDTLSVRTRHQHRLRGPPESGRSSISGHPHRTISPRADPSKTLWGASPQEIVNHDMTCARDC